MASRIRQNFKEESEALINKQINMEFYASYVYMSMYAYFDRDDQVVFFNFDIYSQSGRLSADIFTDGQF